MDTQQGNSKSLRKFSHFRRTQEILKNSQNENPAEDRLRPPRVALIMWGLAIWNIAFHGIRHFADSVRHQ